MGRRHRVEYSVQQSWTLQQQEHHQDEYRRQRQHRRDGAYPHGQYRLSEILTEFDQLCLIAMDPGADVISSHEMTDPASAPLSLSDQRRQGVC